MLCLLIASSLLAQQQYSGIRPKLANITTAAITVVKSGSGQLHMLTVNTPGGNPCKVVIYDNTTNSGTTLATVDCTSGKQNVYETDVTNGITVDTTGDSQPADITVSYN